MSKVTLTDILSLANTASAKQALNDNSAAIEEAMDNTLSRDGTSPNAMEAELDMGEHKILNVADPDADLDAVNKRSIGPLVEAEISRIATTIIEGTARTDVFEATAGQTDFILTDTPGTVNNMMVFDSGIAMTPGVDFTLTGSDAKTLAFYTGRTIGSEIVCRYIQLSPADSILRGDLISSGAGKGSALVDFSAIMPSAGFFKDDDPTTRILRFRDRIFFGDAVNFTGRRTAPYGGDWLTERGASYFTKNAQVAVLGDESEGRYGFLAAGINGGIGGAFVILNETGVAGRAIYAEAMHKSNGQASVAIETATSNITATDFNPSAYSMGGARGLYVVAFNGGMGYTVGDADTPTTEATLPPAAAIDIAGYSTTATRWRKGIVFRNGSLYRGSGDGSSGEAVAIEMAQQHSLHWSVSNGVTGAVIRSDVTTANQDVGLIFGNNVVQIMGTAGLPIMEFVRDASGAGAVNNTKFTNSRTGIAPKFSAQGSDTNVGLELQSKGTGVIRLLGQGGTAESLRAIFNGSYVNFVTVTGGIAAAPVTLAAAGTDTDIDLTLSSKGAGRLRTGYASVAATTPANFVAARRLEIKDSSGTIYYIPLATATW